jgi:Cellulose binding domain
MGIARFTLLVMAGTFAFACAADPGDAPKSDGAGIDQSPGTTSSSGSSGGTIAATPAPTASTGDDGSTTPAPTDDASTGTAEASAPPSCTSCALTLDYDTRDAPPGSTTQTNFDVAINNSGSTPEPLSDFTIKYWFTADGGSGFVLNCYYAASSGIQSNYTGTFTTLTSGATATADTVLTVSFGAGAGSIPAMGSTNDIYLSFHNGAYTTLNQSNDYSYVSADAQSKCSQGNAVTCSATAVTLYRNGVLVFGTEPDGTTAAAGDP